MTPHLLQPTRTLIMPPEVALAQLARQSSLNHSIEGMCSETHAVLLLRWECVLNGQLRLTVPRQSVKPGKPQNCHGVRPHARVSDHPRRVQAHQHDAPAVLHTLSWVHNPLLPCAEGFHHPVTAHLLELLRGRVPEQHQDPRVPPHAKKS